MAFGRIAPCSRSRPSTRRRVSPSSEARGLPTAVEVGQGWLHSLDAVTRVLSDTERPDGHGWISHRVEQVLEDTPRTPATIHFSQIGAVTSSVLRKVLAEKLADARQSAKALREVAVALEAASEQTARIADAQLEQPEVRP